MTHSMALPSTKRQNKWIQDYVAPILLDLDIGRVIDNYKRNQREALSQKMEEVGVYDSLRALEDYGTSWDYMVNKLKEQFHDAELQKGREQWAKMESMKPITLFLKECYSFSDTLIKNQIYKSINLDYKDLMINK